MSVASGVPKDLSSFMFTFVQRDSGVVVLVGHPTLQQLEEALKLDGMPSTLAIIQQEMHLDPKSYELWPVGGETRSFDISVPLSQALKQGRGSR